MVKRSADTAANLSTILWAALGFLAKKRTDKSLLPVETPTKVDVTIEGKIGRKQICERVIGYLNLGTDGQRSATSAADPVRVTALLLAQVPTEKRAEVIAGIIAVKESTSQLPSVHETYIEQADQFLKRLRSSTMATVKGSVTFALNKPKPKPAAKASK
ncbi:hypothetical protein [Aureliella helgolandensis]|uniref:Uncharacterized protein n=1 Tax=Aureliella helgolandensis TaxID=2527968 RepID=A0A518GED6_9BACT|nr:hypothetical protein [Aureliella helgolandensis]QDV26920.1 hypothetical protein Q31a_53000 [Aureliella helgolandensis]